jgi:hypothetical protein
MLPRRACPLVPLRQSAKRFPIPGPPPGAAAYRVTARPNADSFSQINRIVKPRVRLVRRTDLTIPMNKEKGTANLWKQSLDSASGHRIMKFTSGLIVGFHWFLDGKTMAGLRRLVT